MKFTGVTVNRWLFSSDRKLRHYSKVLQQGPVSFRPSRAFTHNFELSKFFWLIADKLSSFSVVIQRLYGNWTYFTITSIPGHCKRHCRLPAFDILQEVDRFASVVSGSPGGHPLHSPNSPPQWTPRFAVNRHRVLARPTLRKPGAQRSAHVDRLQTWSSWFGPYKDFISFETTV